MLQEAAGAALESKIYQSTATQHESPKKVCITATSFCFSTTSHNSYRWDRGDRIELFMLESVIISMMAIP
jgi:hypothetical protein